MMKVEITKVALFYNFSCKMLFLLVANLYFPENENVSIDGHEKKFYNSHLGVAFLKRRICAEFCCTSIYMELKG